MAFLRVKRAFAHIVYVIEKNFGFAFRRYFGVEISYCARNRVARVFKLFFGGLVVFFKHA